MIRLFIDTPQTFAVGASVTLGPDQARYLTSVMRQGEGDEVLIFNGRDGEWRARIVAVGKKSVTLEATEQTRPQPDAAGPVLLIALIKRNRLETVIEKATELGAAVIQPVITRRTIADHTNVSRLKLIAIEAAEQTERLDVPDVREPIKLEKALELYGGHALIFGDEDSTHEEGGGVPGMAGALKSLADKAPAAILIGPEGGFDSQERERLIGHPRALRVNLGPRILRADTAAISALTLYQAVAGDWRR